MTLKLWIWQISICIIVCWNATCTPIRPWRQRSANRAARALAHHSWLRKRTASSLRLLTSCAKTTEMAKLTKTMCSSSSRFTNTMRVSKTAARVWTYDKSSLLSIFIIRRLRRSFSGVRTPAFPNQLNLSLMRRKTVTSRMLTYGFKLLLSSVICLEIPRLVMTTSRNPSTTSEKRTFCLHC